MRPFLATFFSLELSSIFISRIFSLFMSHKDLIIGAKVLFVLLLAVWIGRCWLGFQSKFAPTYEAPTNYTDQDFVSCCVEAFDFDPVDGYITSREINKRLSSNLARVHYIIWQLTKSTDLTMELATDFYLSIREDMSINFDTSNCAYRIRPGCVDCMRNGVPVSILPKLLERVFALRPSHRNKLWYFLCHAYPRPPEPTCMEDIPGRYPQ